MEQIQVYVNLLVTWEQPGILLAHCMLTWSLTCKSNN